MVEVLKANICQLGCFVWKEFDYTRVPPLFAAICCDTSSVGFIPNFLIHQDVAKHFTPGCVDVILSSSLTEAMKTDLLKFLGATYILKENEPGKSWEFGISFWSAATSCCPDEETKSPAIPLSNQETEWARKVFGNVSEFKTLGELEEICNRPTTEYQTQALIIIHRVMSQIHPLPFFNFALIRYSWLLIEKNHLYSRAIDAAMLSLVKLLARDWKDAINSEWPFKVVEGCLDIFWQCLRIQKRENLPTDSPNRLQFPSIIESFRCFS